MNRWLEQLEIKHAEFERCIRYFTYISETWFQMAKLYACGSGKAAYARRVACIYSKMASDCEFRYKRTGVKALLPKQDNPSPLADCINDFWAQELIGLVSSYLY